MFKKTNFCKKPCFTLAELMIAVSIVLLLSAMMYLLLVNCTFSNKTNRERIVALTHAEYMLEDIKNEAFEDLHGDIINELFDTEAYYDEAANDWKIVIGGIILDNALPQEAIIVSATLNDDLMSVEVVVAWQSIRSTESISMETLLVEP